MTSNFKIFRKKAWSSLVKWLRNYDVYPWLYKAYWHWKLGMNGKSGSQVNYFSAVPNPGAGIGHQMANWISGYWFARLFELQFAHIPFSNEKWELFLGLGENEVSVDELVKKNGYKKVLLPLFDEFNAKQVQMIKYIIESYSGSKIVFIAEQDQFYRDQFGVIDELSQRFHMAKMRAHDKLVYSNQSLNIAIHIRRGDIVIGQENKNENLLLRWQDNEYFTNILEILVSNIRTNKPIAVYLFSQGTKDDFKDFNKFENVHFCLEMNPMDSFLHMVYADVLVTSKSSFSYKPALLNKGIKICPKNFWHAYPKREDFIQADESGHFDISLLTRVNATQNVD